MRTLRRARWVVALAAVAVSALIGVGSSTADSVGCGQTLTVDTTLDSDLACVGDVTGLIVEGGVTLNLNGHLITGSGAGTGVAVRAGGTVEHGTVAGFGTGVLASGKTVKSYVTDLTVSENGTGVWLFDAATVANSTVFHNDSNGILVNTGHGSSVVDSRIFQNGADGISAPLFADRATYTGNLIRGNGGNGLFVSQSTSTIIGNVASHNGLAGIRSRDDHLFALGYFFAGNVANHNGGPGIAGCLYGASFDDCDPGVVDGGGNMASHNGGPADCLNVVCARNAGQAKKRA